MLSAPGDVMLDGYPVVSAIAAVDRDRESTVIPTASPEGLLANGSNEGWPEDARWPLLPETLRRGAK